MRLGGVLLHDDQHGYLTLIVNKGRMIRGRRLPVA
jgi:hypothetical protein